MSCPRLDLVDLEFLNDVRRKVLECDRWVARFVIVTRDEFPEGIGRDSNPLARLRREMQAGAGVRRGRDQVGPEPRPGGRRSALCEEASSSR